MSSTQMKLDFLPNDKYQLNNYFINLNFKLMRNLHKLLIVLVSVAFLASGALAQSDASPKVNNQLEQKVKPEKPDQDIQVTSLTEATPVKGGTIVETDSKANMLLQKQRAKESYKSGENILIKELASSKANIGKAPANFVTNPSPSSGGFAKGSTAWAYDFDALEFVNFDTDVPGTFNLIAASPGWDSWAADYDNVNTTFYYIINYATGALQTIDVVTGAIITTIGTPSFAGDFVTGMACDKTTGVMYVIAVEPNNLDYSSLWTLDLSTAVATLVGQTTPGEAIIDIAVDGNGDMYGFGIVNDEGLSIDKTTAAATVLGTLGYDANYGQGMAYDPEEDIIYLCAYNNDGSGGQLRIFDPVTGSSTLVGGFPNGDQTDAFAFPGTAQTFTNDLAVLALVSPVTGPELGMEDVTINIFNFGTAAQSNFDVYYTIDGGAPVTETVSATINGGESYEYTFIQQADLSAYGIYVIEACTDLVGDENPDNDCQDVSVENFGLPTMEISPDSINVTLDPFATTTEYIDITNNGSGVLNWGAQIVYPEGKDPGDLLLNLDFESLTGDNQLLGAEWDGSYLWVTSRADIMGGPTLYKIDIDGPTLIESYPQGTTSLWGMRDPAFVDGFLYAGDDNGFYKIDPSDGSVETVFTGTVGIGCIRALAYVPGYGFFSKSFGSDIVQFDMAGTIINTWPDNPSITSCYGAAYDELNDCVWWFDQSDAVLNKWDYATGTLPGETIVVPYEVGNGGIAGGAMFSTTVVPGKAIIGGMVQGSPDSYFAIELGDASVWLSIDPNNGTVDPGNTDIMDVMFDATDILPGTILEADIHFTSDPNVGEVDVHVTLVVGGLEVGYIEGNVLLDGIAPYNIGNVEEVVVSAGPYFASPDASGDYSIIVYPGTYDVVSTLYGYADATVTGVVVAEGQTVSGIDLVMDCLYGMFAGTVTDIDSGDPIENAEVVVVGTGFSDVTNADGEYEILIEAGTYDLTADHQTYLPETVTDVALGAQTTETVDFELQFQLQYCDASGGCDEFIDGVEFGDINNMGTGCTNYGDYTSMSTLCEAGETYTLTWYTGNMWASDDYGIWIDFNQDGDFYDSGENVICVWDAGQDVYNFDITIPGDAVEGPTRMRLRLKWSGSDCGDPCGTTTYGEVEDYTVIIGQLLYGSLNGYVTEINYGTPVEGATVSSGTLSETTNADGFYEFAEILVGVYDFEASAVWYWPSGPISVEIFAGQTTEQDFEIDYMTGIDEVSLENLNIFPNPATNQVNINSDFNISTLKVYNFTGEVVFEGEINATQTQINTSEFEAGVYLLQIFTDNGIANRNVIIK
jgi:hypothetical protein